MKKNKNYYKVLELSFPFNQQLKRFQDCVDGEIKPIFHRNGIYIDRRFKIAWIETNYGSYDICSKYESLMLDLKHLNHIALEPHVIKAIKILIRNNLADKKLKDLLYTDLDIKDLKNFERKLRLQTLRWKKTLNRS